MRKAIVICASIVWLVHAARATTFSWDGGGIAARWSNGTNWAPDATGAEPDADDTVINPGPSGGVSTNDVARTISAFIVQLGQNTTVDLGGVPLGATGITVAEADASGSASLSFRSGMLDVSGTLAMAHNNTGIGTPNGTLNLSNVTARIGTLWSNRRFGNGTINVDGGSVTVVNTAIIGYGEVGSGSRKGTMTLRNGASLNFGAGGTRPDVDVGRAGYRGAVGTLDASAAVVSGSIRSLDIGIGTGANGGPGTGTVKFGQGTVDVGTLQMGDTDQVSGVHSTGLLELLGTSMTVTNCFLNERNGSGTLIVQGGGLRITDVLQMGRGNHNLGFTPAGRVIAGEGAQVIFGRPDGTRADVLVGWSTFRSGTGTLDLRGGVVSGSIRNLTIGRSSTLNAQTGTGVALLGEGSLDILNMTIGIYENGTAALGTLDMNATVIVSSNVTVSAGGGTGRLHLQSGARLEVLNSLTVAANGTSSNTVQGLPGGLDLADSVSLSLSTPHQITFLDPRPEFSGIYWGFRWAGNHTNDLATTYAGKIVWDADSLNPDFGTPEVFLSEGFTYVGLDIRSGILLLTR